MQDASVSQLTVTTFRKGILSRLGHDLRLRLTTFAFELRGDQLTGRFDLRTLHVVGAVEHDRVRSDVPSAGDRQEIELAIAGVLKTAAHPEAELAGRLEEIAHGARWSFSGTLTLAGEHAPLAAEVARREDVFTAGVELIPSRFGIAPYKALGGALRLDDRVQIEVRLPVAAAHIENWSVATGVWKS